MLVTQSTRYYTNDMDHRLNKHDTIRLMKECFLLTGKKSVLYAAQKKITVIIAK